MDMIRNRFWILSTLVTPNENPQLPPPAQHTPLHSFLLCTAFDVSKRFYLY